MADGVYTKDTGRDRITVRFGDPILQDGFTTVPNLVLNYYSQLGISQAEMLFIIHVWQFWWTEKNPYPSLNTIATRMNVSRRQARNYVQSLKTKAFDEQPGLHILEVFDRFAPGIGQTSSEYDFSGLFRAIVLISQGETLTPRKNSSEGGRKIISEVPRKSSSPEEDEEKTDEKRRNSFSNIRKGTPKNGIVDNSVDNGGDNTASHPVTPARTASLPLHAYTPPTIPVVVARDDNGLSRMPGEVESVGAVLKRGRGRPPKQPYSEERQQIAAYIADFAREMGDTAPLTSSVTRAYNLYQAAGWPITRFIDALYQARAKTKERTAAIRGKSDAAAPFAPKAKMAYFFALVEDELGLRPHEQLPLDA